MEILMVTGLLAYIMNYIIGKNKNSRLAHTWFNSHRELLESNFALVGESFQLSNAAFLTKPVGQTRHAAKHTTTASDRRAFRSCPQVTTAPVKKP